MNREIKFRAFNHLDKEMYSHGVVLNILYNEGIGLKEPEGKWSIMQYSIFKDKNGKPIIEGDIIALKNAEGRDIKAICRLGSSIRSLNGVDVEIDGFYFEVNGFHSFPIVENYLGKHDTEIFEVIGNIYEHPQLSTP